MKDINIIYVNKLPFNLRGITINPSLILIDKKHKGNTKLLIHELIHCMQMYYQGFSFYLNYFFYLLIYGYENNPYEIQARYYANKIQN